MDKKEIRKQYRALRKQLDHKEERSREIVKRLCCLPEYQKSRVIGLYLALEEEVCLDALAERIRKDGKTAAVPRTGRDGRMDMVVLGDLGQTCSGAYGIREPLSGSIVLPDWIIVPGIAFDLQGYRTGFGGGYYDRYLAEHGIPSAGAAFEIQVSDAPLEHAEHDVPVDVIVTEKRTVRITDLR